MTDIVRLFDTTMQAEVAYRQFISDKPWRFVSVTMQDPFVAILKSGEQYRFMSVYRFVLWGSKQGCYIEDTLGNRVRYTEVFYGKK